jgi:hypothetical protein
VVVSLAGFIRLQTFNIDAQQQQQVNGEWFCHCSEPNFSLAELSGLIAIAVILILQLMRQSSIIST